MSREKQIEEIFNDMIEAENRFHEHCLSNVCHDCEYYGDGECDNHIKAEFLYNAGYRKQIEAENVAMYPTSAFECSLCGWSNWDLATGDGIYKYCPNCGAKMKGGE